MGESTLAQRRPRIVALLLAACASLYSLTANASLFAGEALDTVADWIAIVVLFVVPAVVIVVFWLVHVLPEKIAEKRHHPQKDAINTLCLLSLVFGGLLWPLAWLWAYTKPVGYRMAYGTDKHEDYFDEMGEQGAAKAKLVAEEIEHLREELDAMAARGPLPPELRDAARRARRAACAACRNQRTGSLDGNPPPRHLLVLRLADLHQVQVAAVEHHVAGHRRHHPDRRADGADPHAERLRAVVGEVRVFKYTIPIVSQVRGRVLEVPVEEGNRLVHKGDVLFRIDPTPYQLDVANLEAQLANAQGGQRETEESLTGAKAKVMEARAAIAQAERAHRRSRREARARAQARRAEPRARASPAPATASTSSRPRPTSRS